MPEISFELLHQRAQAAYEKTEERARTLEGQNLEMMQHIRKLTAENEAMRGLLNRVKEAPPAIEGFRNYKEANHLLELYDGPLDLVVDIGAHIGSLTVLAARKGATKILAYEPNPEAFRMLKHNTWLYNCRQAEVFPLAVTGSKIGSRKLYIPPGNIKNHDYSVPTAQASLVIDAYVNWVWVETVRFKDLLSSYGVIDYLKVDVEEAEYEMFDGITAQDMAKVRFLDLDVHNHFGEWDRKARDFVDYIATLGFEEDAFPEVQLGVFDIGRFNKNFVERGCGRRFIKS